MKIINWNKAKINRPTAVSWGIFDGMHIAHQKLMKKLVSLANKQGLEPVIITFPKHPAHVLHNVQFDFITSLEKRLDLIESTGITKCVLINFTKKFSKTSGGQFLNLLKRKLNNRLILLGYDTRFGFKRKYGKRESIKLCENLGIKLIQQEKIKVEGITISSKTIRKNLERGRLDIANKLLGRNYSVEGKVIRGQRLGRKIGFPTANIKWDNTPIIPFGVYKTLSKLGNRFYKSATHYGPKPTLSHNNAAMETHLINLEPRALYGKPIKVEFIKKIRGIKKFKNLTLLKKQLQKDISAID